MKESIRLSSPSKYTNERLLTLGQQDSRYGSHGRNFRGLLQQSSGQGSQQLQHAEEDTPLQRFLLKNDQTNSRFLSAHTSQQELQSSCMKSLYMVAPPAAQNQSTESLPRYPVFNLNAEREQLRKVEESVQERGEEPITDDFFSVPLMRSLLEKNRAAGMEAGVIPEECERSSLHTTGIHLDASTQLPAKADQGIQAAVLAELEQKGLEPLCIPAEPRPKLKLPPTLCILETMVATYRKDYIFRQSMLKLIEQLKLEFLQANEQLERQAAQLTATRKKKRVYKQKYLKFAQRLPECQAMLDRMINDYSNLNLELVLMKTKGSDDPAKQGGSFHLTKTLGLYLQGDIHRKVELQGQSEGEGHSGTAGSQASKHLGTGDASFNPVPRYEHVTRKKTEARRVSSVTQHKPSAAGAETTKPPKVSKMVQSAGSIQNLGGSSSQQEKNNGSFSQQSVNKLGNMPLLLENAEEYSRDHSQRLLPSQTTVQQLMANEGK